MRSTIILLFIFAGLIKSGFCSCIVTQPQSQTVCTGASIIITLSASGDTSLQWQTFTGSWVNLANDATYSGVTNDSLTINNIDITFNNNQYRCIVLGDTCTDSSSVVTLTVNPDPSITSQPANNTICSGGSNNFSISANGGISLSYQWQYFSGSWNNVSNGTPTGATYSNQNTTTMTVTGITATGTHQFRCVVSSTGSDCNTVNSNAGTLTVNPDPSITSQPTNNTICSGGSSDFSVTASGGISLSYQWQYFSGSWNNVANGTPTGATYSNQNTTTMTVTGITATGTHQFRCVVSSTGSDCNTINSNAGTLTVNPDPSITSQPTDDTICSGGSSSFSATASGGISLSYQWQYFSGSWNNVVNGTPAGATFSNQTTTTMTVTGISASGTHQFRCVVSSTGSDCNTINSNAGTLTVNPDPAITSQPANDIICSGGSSNFSVTASGGIALSYQWQYNSGTWNNVTNGTPAGATYSNQTTATMSVTGITATGTHQFRCVASSTGSDCNTVNSNAGTLTVNPDPSITSQPANDTICYGGSSSFSVTASGGISLSYQWQYNSGTWNNVTNGTPTGANFSNQTTTTMTVTGITATGAHPFRCVVSSTGSDCNTVNSNARTLTVKPLPLVTNTPFSQTICSGNNTSLVSLTSDLSGTTFNWLVTSASPGISGFNNNPSNPYPVISIQNLTNNGNNPGTVIYTITPTADGCVGVDTNYIITVNPLPVINAGLDIAICTGDSAQLNASGGVTYNWSPASYLNNSTISNPIAFPASTTVYAVTATDINGCINIDDVTVTVNTLPNVNAGTDSSIICTGESVTLFANGGLTYSWAPQTGLNFPYIANPIATPANITTYIVTGTDGNGCSDTASVMITVSSLPSAVVSNPQSICIGNNIILNASGGSSSSWNTGDTTANITVMPVTTTTYTVTVFNTDGCEDTASVTVTVNTLPVANAGADVSICSGDSVQLNASGGISYSWLPVTGLNDSTISNPIANPTNSTTYTMSVTDTNGCINTDSVAIAVISNPSVSISGKSQVCKNEYWVEYCISPTVNNITWTVTNGNIMTGQGTNCIKVHWSDAALSGTVSVAENFWNTPYCASYDTFIVTITNNTAPSPATIIAKSNDISTKMLICQYCSYQIYQWGYESKINPTEIFTCSGATWCSYNSIDTNNYYYWVKVGDNSSCLTKSYFNAPPVITGIHNIETQEQFSIFPNPSNGNFIISLTNIKAKEIEIKVFNILGELIYIEQENLTSNKHLKQIEIGEKISSGIYMVHLKIDNKLFANKIIVEK